MSMKARQVPGLLGSLALILSAPAHSLMGWPPLEQQLVALGAPADLTQGLMVGWHFAGAAMVAMGLVTMRVFWVHERRPVTSTFPAVVIGVAYLLFGAWALTISGFNPVFLVFVIPAVLLLVGAALC
jgi:hypothetical protein